MNDLFSYMETWYEEHRESLRDRGLKVVISPVSDTAKPARFMDIESGRKFGRLVVWSTGEAEIQIENLSAATTELITTLSLRTHDDITRAISKLIAESE